jgi:hypothetical protein
VLALNTPVQGFGAFVAVNATDGTQRKAKNIIRARALFADAEPGRSRALPRVR